MGELKFLKKKSSKISRKKSTFEELFERKKTIETKNSDIFDEFMKKESRDNFESRKSIERKRSERRPSEKKKTLEKNNIDSLFPTVKKKNYNPYRDLSQPPVNKYNVFPNGNNLYNLNYNNNFEKLYKPNYAFKKYSDNNDISNQQNNLLQGISNRNAHMINKYSAKPLQFHSIPQMGSNNLYNNNYLFGGIKSKNDGILGKYNYNY